MKEYFFIEEVNMSNTKKIKRKYYRKCGLCSERHEQSEMIRTECSPNGWICKECKWKEHPEYEVEFDD